MADLEGILVVSLEQAVAAPLATARLADAGARVIKVERPEGDFARGYDRLVHGESAYFVWINRGKESICLDLRQSEDMALMRRMLASADVFVQNLAPGAADRLGLGAADLCQAHPQLIHVSISGYGEDGPYRDQKAYDLLIQGESGLLSVNGADWMNVPYLQTRYGGAPPPRMGLRHPSIAPYGAFVCADGREVLLSVQNNREWAALCTAVLQTPELVSDPRFSTNVARVSNRAEIDALLAPVLGELDREAAMAALSNAGIACGRLSSLEDMVTHSQARHLSTETPSGPVEMMARGVRFSDSSPASGAVPALGEHSAALRAEFHSHGRRRA
jgi:crotonobetainyl-CoA:carnitine CoA-transferase CaiB-like acyl-CoA transferase